MPFKIAVVTGAYEGIGYALVRKLATELPTREWMIYLVSPDMDKGLDAWNILVAENLPNIVKFYKMDACDAEERQVFIDFVKFYYSRGISLWVNHATLYSGDLCDAAPEENVQDVEATFAVNYFGTIAITQDILPHMTKNSNLVFITSIAGLELALKKLSPDRYKDFMAIESIDSLNEAVKSYIECCKNRTIEEKGWARSPYALSKMAITKAALLFAKQLANNSNDIIVTACCPGHDLADLGNLSGSLSVEQDCLTPFVCATTRNPEHNGKFFHKSEPLVWDKDGNAKENT